MPDAPAGARAKHAYMNPGGNLVQNFCSASGPWHFRPFRQPPGHWKNSQRRWPGPGQTICTGIRGATP
eukprot:6004676-Alexandrium_andersonii.AAC.1